MEFRVLGPFEVLAQGAPVNLGGRQRRTVLAILTALSNESVSTERLIDEIWGVSPPSAARKSVQAHIAHLRRVLNVDREILISAGDGYALNTGPESVDSQRFEARLSKARASSSSDPGEAVEAYEAALAMFRGAPFAGLADDAFTLRVEASRLQEMRLGAIEDRLDAMLQVGRERPVATEAERLVAEHPLRERLWALLMLAQYRAGRQAEALRSYARARQTLAEELGLEPSEELQRLEQQILDHEVEELSLEVPDGIAVRGAIHPTSRNPYKGLRPFDEEDASDFFGRDDLVRRLDERLRSRGRSHLTVLAGPSGAGKSSVVRAGVIPLLRERDVPVAVMTPGEDPMDALARSLVIATGRSHEDVVAGLDIRGTLDEELTVVVDQLEELFTVVDEAGLASRFVELMASDTSGLRWVATIRADFLDRLLSHPTLGPLVEEALVLIPPLREHEVRAAVEGPARRVGLAVDPELLAAIVNDVQARPAALPLLQYALTDTFERGDGSALRLGDYQRSGGISGVIARRSDDLYSTLTPEQQALAHQMFLHLVTVGDDDEIARRRVDRQTLLHLGDEQTMSRIIERFGTVRFLTFDHEAGSGRPTVELAHEALITEWPQLSGWIDQARDDLRISRRLRAAVSEWRESGRDQSFLMGGARLAEMESWRDATSLTLSASALAFLAESRDVEDTALRRRRFLRSSAVLVLGVTAAVAIVFAILAQRSAEEARDQAAVAEEQSERAESEAARADEERINAEEAALLADARRLAARSLADLDTDPGIALVEAIESVRILQDGGLDVLRESEEALHMVVQSVRTVHDLDGGGAAHFSADGSRVVGGGAGEALVWDATTGEPVIALEHNGAVFNAVFSADARLVATVGEDEMVRVWNSESGEEVATLATGTAPLSISFSPSGDFLAVSYSSEGAVRLWETESWTEAALFPCIFPLGVNFNADGDLLAVADAERLAVYQIPSGNISQEIFTEDPSVEFADVAFSPDAPFLVATGGDQARIYRTEPWALEDQLFGHLSNVEAVDVGRNGLVATGSIDGQVRVWDLHSGRQLMVLSGQGAGVLNVSLHPSGELVAAGTANQSLRIWDITPAGSHEWYTLDEHPLVTDADFGPDGEYLATGGFDSTARVWEADTGLLLDEFAVHDGPVRRVELGPGGILATASFDGNARVFDVVSGELLHVFPGQGAVGGVSISDDGALLAFSSGPSDVCRPGPGFVQVRGLDDGSLVFSGQVADDSLVTDVSMAPDGSWFAVASCGILRTFDTATGELNWQVQAHEGFAPAIIQVDVSPDGAQVVTASWDGVVKVWDAPDGQLRRTFSSHTGEVWGVEFSPDGSLVASAAHDGTVRLWNVMGGYEILSIQGHGSAVDDVAFSADGTRLASVGRDETVRVNALDVDDLLNLAHDRLERFGLIYLDG